MSDEIEVPQPRTDLLEPYKGFGKYEGEMNLTEVLDGLDEDGSTGDMDTSGYYRLYRFTAADVGGPVENYLGAILVTTSQGFVSAEYFSNDDWLTQRWAAIASEVEVEEWAYDDDALPYAQALCAHEMRDLSEVTDASPHTEGGWIIAIGRMWWHVATDSEADDAWDREMDSFIDENVLGELPERYRKYFDREAYKDDAKHDGRGIMLAHYDSNEDEEVTDDETYYIYRTN